MLKTVVLPNIFVETVIHLIFQDLFETEIFFCSVLSFSIHPIILSVLSGLPLVFPAVEIFLLVLRWLDDVQACVFLRVV